MSGVQSIASAVMVPDADDIAPAPSPATKRRRSDASDESSKRRRLSNSADGPAAAASPPSPPADPERPHAKPPGRDSEERKRGKRLFGALLGALSQRGGSSTAQKRRGDIERKQQEKLRQQEQEYDEEQEGKRGALLAARRKEQTAYEEQSMRVRHDNLLAMAHSLQTKAELGLYYKPWRLRPEEQARIDKQVEEAKATIGMESGEGGTAIADAERGSEPAKSGGSGPTEGNGPDTTGAAMGDHTGNESNGTVLGDNKQPDGLEVGTPARNGIDVSNSESMDDGGDDLVKGDEDDVMY